MSASEREGATLRVGGVEVTPIERTELHGGGAWAFASKTCVALRIRDAEGERILHVDGQGP